VDCCRLPSFICRIKVFLEARRPAGHRAVRCLCCGCTICARHDDDRVLEIGFRPGVGIRLLSEHAPGGYIAGIDPSKEMIEQAAARNAEAASAGRVDLRHGSIETLPFSNRTFDKVIAINSMRVWSDAAAGPRECAES
jgi:ubiquinone/menaquinone biosynthesis C-methylase UbiE